MLSPKSDGREDRDSEVQGREKIAGLQRRGVDGVVIGVDTDVVVASESNPVVPAQPRRHRRRGSIAARSASSRSTGRALIARTIRALARGQPAGELAVEVRRRGELPPGHEGGLEEPVAALHDPLRLRVLRW
jgi:hypothetical protein